MKKLEKNNIDYLAGVTFGYDLRRDDYFKDEPIKSLEAMKDETGANTVVLAFHAFQDDPNSIIIDYIGEDTPTKEGLKRIIYKARELELYVVLKPMLDCRNGTWRGHVNFFDKDVPCEPKWSEWFAAYTEYQVYFAKIAEELEVDMLCIACEMVQTQRREPEWRTCIAEIRKHYSGIMTWNCDKYQEDEVNFWDALDVISSSGYYPINDWDNQLDRIEKVALQYNKPVFFIECGCMSCKTSPAVPNCWQNLNKELAQNAAKIGIDAKRVTLQYKDFQSMEDDIKELYKSVVNFEAQADFYKTIFEKCSQRSFVRGFGLWDWHGKLSYDKDTVCYDGTYALHLKPAAEVIKAYYQKCK